MGVPGRCWFVHHAQHRGTARFQDPPNQQACESEKRDVEPGRVVPCDGGLNHARVALCRDETKSPEYQFDDQRGTRHRRIEGDKQEAGHLQSVIFAVDVQDRENNQIGEDECDHPPKLMPPFQSTAASGIFPTGHTNEMTATSGPTSGPHSLARSGWSTRKKDCQNSEGTQAASAPAMIRPPTISSHTEAQSITK